MTARTSLVLLAFVFSPLMMIFGLVRFGFAQWNRLHNANGGAAPDYSDLGIVLAGVAWFCFALLAYLLLSWLLRKESKKLKGAYFEDFEDKEKKGRWRIYW